MKRRASVIGKRGAGIHQPQTGQQTRPAGQIKPIISKSKHGKTVKQKDEFHDTDENNLPDIEGLRRAIRAWLWALAALAVFAVAMCSATVAQGQTAPDIEFRSLFQIRAALPDTVLLLHEGYNIRIDAAGVECVPLNPAAGTLPTIPVQSWIQGDSGEWIGITKGGATVTVWHAGRPEMYLEIATTTTVMDFYNMLPAVLHWKERNKQ